MADEIEIGPSGGILLTSSIVDNKVTYMADALGIAGFKNGRNRSISLKSYMDAKTEFNNQRAQAFRILDEISSFDITLQHLTLFSIAHRKNFKALDASCRPTINFGVILDENYFETELLESGPNMIADAPSNAFNDAHFLRTYPDMVILDPKTLDPSDKYPRNDMKLEGCRLGGQAGR